MMMHIDTGAQQREEVGLTMTSAVSQSDDDDDGKSSDESEAAQRGPTVLHCKVPVLCVLRGALRRYVAS